jgi:hypothetical protein
MRKVYRVERLGRGPYSHPNLTCEDIGIDGWATSRRPMPYSDDLNYPSWKDARYGFGDLKQLRSWFNKAERKKLAKHDFVVTTLEVRGGRIREGRKQLVFGRKSARIIRQRPISA